MAKIPNPATPDPAATPSSFEHALSELESIVDSMEKGDLQLEASLAAYQRGTVLLKYCQDMLTSAENRIRVFDQGNLTELKPGDAPSSDGD